MVDLETLCRRVKITLDGAQRRSGGAWLTERGIRDILLVVYPRYSPTELRTAATAAGYRVGAEWVDWNEETQW